MAKQKFIQTRIPATAEKALAARILEMGLTSEASYLRVIVLRDLGIITK